MRLMVLIDLDVTIATIFDGQYFQKIENPFENEEKSLLSPITFMFLAHNSVQMT